MNLEHCTWCGRYVAREQLVCKICSIHWWDLSLANERRLNVSKKSTT